RRAAVARRQRWLHPPALPLPGRVVRPGCRAAGAGPDWRRRPGPARSPGRAQRQLRQRLRVEGTGCLALGSGIGGNHPAGVAGSLDGHRSFPAPDPAYGDLMASHELKHLISDAPRVMVADGSKLVRKLIADVLKRELPNVQVVGCSSIEEARQALEQGTVDLVTTALPLPDGDGMELAPSVRAAHGQ